MEMTLNQLAARVDVGSPMHRRRYQRMQHLNQHRETPTRFDAHLRRQRHQMKQPAMMPPTAEDKTEQPVMMPPAVEDKKEPPALPPPTDAMRTAYRKGYMHGFKHMRKVNPDAHQSQMGWVTARLSRALTDNPFMADKDIEALVDSLVASMPGYEGDD